MINDYKIEIYNGARNLIPKCSFDELKIYLAGLLYLKHLHDGFIVWFKTAEAGLFSEWRAYNYIVKWLNATNENYNIQMSNITEDTIDKVDIIAYSLKLDKPNLTFQVKSSDVYDPNDYPLVTHFVIVRDKITIVANKSRKLNQ